MWWRSTARGCRNGRPVCAPRPQAGGGGGGGERGLCRRCEQAGETLFCYTEDPQAVVADLDSNANGGLRYLHRPANLEDVFLKLTGRDLRD